MQSELAFIFSNVYDELFTYDAKYNELKFKDTVNAAFITETITRKSKGLRDIWYRCYPSLMKAYKLTDTYDCDHLLGMIEMDDEYPYIPDAFVTEAMMNEHLFRKPIEQDYRFDLLKDDNDRRHYRFTKAIRYLGEGLNIEKYVKLGLIGFDQAEFALNLMDIKYSVEYLNQIGKIEPIAKRLFETDKDESLFDQLTEDAKRIYANHLVKVKRNLCRFKVLPYIDIMDEYTKFNFGIDDVSCSVTKEIAKRFNAVMETNDDRLKSQWKSKLLGTIDHCVKYPHSAEYLNLVLQHGTVKQVVTACFINDPSTVLWILKQREDCVIEYLCELVNRKVINRDNFNDFTDGIIDNPTRFDIGFAWVRTYKEEPPLAVYPNPNYRENSTKDQRNPRKQWQTGVTIEDVWAQYVNASTTPMEMKSVKYYDYMVKSGGVKRNPNQTIMYSYFSNSNENKLIFCKSDVELLDPAVPRYYIPVEFKRLKQYLHEDLLTTDICMFAQLTKNDWEKIAGGKEDIDVVVFNDMKNVYRERTQLKEVIKYLIDNIEIEFDEAKCAKAGAI